MSEDRTIRIIAGSSFRRPLTLAALAALFFGYIVAIPAAVLRIHAGRSQDLPIGLIALGSLLGLLLVPVVDAKGRKRFVVFTLIVSSTLTAVSTFFGSGRIFGIVHLISHSAAVVGYASIAALVLEDANPKTRGRDVGVLAGFAGIGVGLASIITEALESAALAVAIGGIGLSAAFTRGVAESDLWLYSARKLHRQGAFRALKSSRTLGQLIQASALSLCISAAVVAPSTWWIEFAASERTLDRSQAAAWAALAYGVGLLGYFVAGFLQDRLGRRKTGTLFLLLFALSAGMAFRATVPFFFLNGAAISAFFGFGTTSVALAVSGELFPTESRATAIVVSRALATALGAVVGSTLIGLLGRSQMAVGDSALFTAWVFALLALLLLQLIPETAGRELGRIMSADAIPPFQPIPAMFEPDVPPSETEARFPRLPDPRMDRPQAPPDPE